MEAAGEKHWAVLRLPDYSLWDNLLGWGLKVVAVALLSEQARRGVHEYSIVQALLERVEAEARSRGATSVERVRVRIGELSGVEADLLASAYELFRQDSICSQAELEMVPVAARWICPGCGKEIPRGAILRCAVCGRPASLDQGGDILLERIEMEVA